MPIPLRPDVNTKFHIDLNWWEKSRKDIRIYLKDLLCEACQEKLATTPPGETSDWVDPETAEVVREDNLWHAVRTCCSQKEGYITPETPIIDAIFMTFMANGNKPLSIMELHEKLDKRSPETILRMLTRGQTYMGIRPYRG